VNTLMKNSFCLFMLVCTLCIALPLSAQEKVKGLIVSEVYLDKEQPGNSWIEVYNPTDKPLVLERFRLSHIRTINVLPASIQEQGGVVIKPNEYLVLCADKVQFESAWGKQTEPLFVKALTLLAEGGFVAIATKDVEEAGSDGFRYGDPLKSSHVKEYFGSQVLNFSRNGKSYSRKMIKTAEGINISDWYESVPAPGLPNEEK